MSEFHRIRTFQILIVEDDPVTARLLMEGFSTQCALAGYTGCFFISVTPWGETAMEWLVSDGFDGYVIDGNLKGRAHGIDVINRIRQRDERSPIVLHCSGAKDMRAVAILHDLVNIEKATGSADAAARHIIDKLYAPAT